MAATTMAMAGSPATASLRVERKAASSLSSSAAISRVGFGGARKQQRQRVAPGVTVNAAKELHFNKDGSAIKRMQVWWSCLWGLGFLLGCSFVDALWIRLRCVTREQVCVLLVLT